MSWGQVARLLAQATGDLAYSWPTRLRKHKPSSDAEREARVDRELHGGRHHARRSQPLPDRRAAGRPHGGPAMSAPALAAHGIATGCPEGGRGELPAWQRAPRRRASAEAPSIAARAARSGRPRAARSASPGRSCTSPTSGCPPTAGDFGSGAADLMGRGHVLLVLFEHGPESVGTRCSSAPRPADAPAAPVPPEHAAAPDPRPAGLPALLHPCGTRVLPVRRARLALARRPALTAASARTRRDRR